MTTYEQKVLHPEAAEHTDIQKAPGVTTTEERSHSCWVTVLSGFICGILLFFCSYLYVLFPHRHYKQFILSSPSRA